MNSTNEENNLKYENWLTVTELQRKGEEEAKILDATKRKSMKLQNKA